MAQSAVASVTGTAAEDANIVGIQTVPNPEPTNGPDPVAKPDLIIVTTTPSSAQPTSAAADKPKPPSDGDDDPHNG